MSIIWRHILIGADSAFSRCRPQDVGLGTWDYLKFHLQQLKLQYWLDDDLAQNLRQGRHSPISSQLLARSRRWADNGDLPG